jgi:hypothetical protein
MLTAFDGSVRAAGVYWDGHHGRWCAWFSDGETKSRYLGSFVNKVDAALAFAEAAQESPGDVSKLTSPHLPIARGPDKTPGQATSQYRGKSNLHCTTV